MSEPAQDRTHDRTQDRAHYRICPLCEACCGLEVRTAGASAVLRSVWNLSAN